MTTFFPRWFVDDITEADHWYVALDDQPATQPLCDEARRLGIGFASDTHCRRRRSSVELQTLVERDGSIVASYTKSHSRARSTR